MTAVADGAECKLAIEFKGRGMDMREQELHVMGLSECLRRQ